MNIALNKRNAKRRFVQRRARLLMQQAQAKAFQQLTPETTRRLALADLVRMQACGCEGRCTCGLSEGVRPTIH